MGFLDDYEPVEDRLRAFWSEHRTGRVTTELVESGKEPGDILVFKASVWREPFKVYGYGTTEMVTEQPPDATGYAHQRLLSEPPVGRNGKPNESAPEWTSPFEVAETSAIGRALANLGYAAKGKRPSREEMSKTSASRAEAPDGAESSAELPGPAEGSPAPAQVQGDGGVSGEVQASSPEHRFTVLPKNCSHKIDDEWAPTIVMDGKSRCSLCGTPSVKYRESTGADLGSA
jgi:hypothetical protein